MKPKNKIILVILVVGLCVVLGLFFIKAANRQAICRMSVAKESTVVSAPIKPQTNATLLSAPKLPEVVSNVVVPVAGKKALPESVIPTGIVYRSTAFIAGNENFASILAAVSNAVLLVDNILKTQNYKVHEFSRTKWLVAEDKEHSTVWTIHPYRTNAVVGSIEAVVYQDAALTRKDTGKSFRMSFYPESGALRDFWWGDDHEVVCLQTNGACDYGRSAGGNMGLTMRWDSAGKLIFSNRYDRTRLGKPIGGQPPKALPSRPPWPTSSVEAATESWRQRTNSVVSQSSTNETTGISR